MKERKKIAIHIHRLSVLQIITKIIIMYQHKIIYNEEMPSNNHTDSQESLPGTYKKLWGSIKIDIQPQGLERIRHTHI